MLFAKSAENSLFMEEARMVDRNVRSKYTSLESYGMGPNVMKKLKVCRRCGHLSSRWALLCPDCKKPLNYATLFDDYKNMHTLCPHCGIPLTSDTHYCPNCGRKQ